MQITSDEARSLAHTLLAKTTGRLDIHESYHRSFVKAEILQAIKSLQRVIELLDSVED